MSYFNPKKNDVLVVIDVQNDFCPGGSLAVPKGNEVVPIINNLISKHDHVVLTQDWHTPSHASFASVYGKNPYEKEELIYGTQILWPDHCVQGTNGAQFHKELAQDRADIVIRKGFRPGIDSYSAFRENDQTTPTGLAGYLRERGFSDLFFCGLAFDFCVKWSALDAVAEGFSATVIENACRAIDIDGSADTARKELLTANVKLINI